MSQSRRAKPRPTRRDLLQASGGAALIGALGAMPEISGRASASQDDQAAGACVDTHIHVVAPGLPGMKPPPKEIGEIYGGHLPRWPFISEPS